MKLNVKLLIILIVALILLILPILLKENDLKIGEYSYFYERMVNLAEEKLNYDRLSYSGRDFTYDFGPVSLLLFLNNFFDIKILLFVLPIFFGLITIFLFYFLLRKLDIEENVIILTLVFFIISPVIFYIFTSYNKFTVILPLIFLFINLFIYQNKFFKLSSLIFLFLLGFFSYKAILMSLLFILIYLIKQKNLKQIYLPLFISFISLIIAYLSRLITYGIINTGIEENYFKNLFSDLGSLYGLSIALFFFLIFGLNYLWKSKYKYIHVYIAFLILIILTILNKDFIIYFNFLAFYLAALGVNYLINSKWDSEIIRKLTIFLLIFILIFSSYNSLLAIKNSQPNKEVYDALVDLRNYGSNDDIVFSHYKYGILINSIANRKNFMDNNFNYIKDIKERYDDMQTLFYTRNADLAKKILTKYNIKYILITNEMKEGLVWNQKDEGLLFVLENSKEFRRVIYSDKVEIWRVK